MKKFQVFAFIFTFLLSQQPSFAQLPPTCTPTDVSVEQTHHGWGLPNNPGGMTFYGPILGSGWHAAVNNTITFSCTEGPSQNDCHICFTPKLYYDPNHSTTNPTWEDLGRSPFRGDGDFGPWEGLADPSLPCGTVNGTGTLSFDVPYLTSGNHYKLEVTYKLCNGADLLTVWVSFFVP